jgi:NADP-dependent 3-hydroxy acid dehydrogenase YdfG
MGNELRPREEWSSRETRGREINMQNSSKKLALVTGANKASDLKSHGRSVVPGAKVLLGARNKAAGEGAAATLTGGGIDTRFIAIDVVDYNSLEAAAGTYAHVQGS